VNFELVVLEAVYRMAQRQVATVGVILDRETFLKMPLPIVTDWCGFLAVVKSGAPAGLITRPPGKVKIPPGFPLRANGA